MPEGQVGQQTTVGTDVPAYIESIKATRDLTIQRLHDQVGDLNANVVAQARAIRDLTAKNAELQEDLDLANEIIMKLEDKNEEAD